ncbi:hypothetical protein FOMAKNOH_02135 [Mannheimia haemolytica]|uniref:Uncharacterized protein n=4 Tax=Mannheimia haemolytica TaxID=75985 RepID=A0A378N9W4_MANHA|nr:hypothetical protein [Mannheimia haemolytica]STY65263.1 Uncharacterised protein [Mannheimia haemolytica]
MRFTSTINNVRLVEWEINITQGALVDLINQASSWAKAVVIDGITYYWMSFSKVCEELPAVFSKEDTVYRQYKVLKEKGIIDHFKMDGKDYVRLTEKGCEWNKFEPIRESEKNPSVGNQSEQTRKNFRESSEKNPTDNNTNYKNTNDHNNTLTGINAHTRETKKSAVLVLLEQFDITGKLAEDFIVHRKAKKAPITETALNGYQREADKAKIPIQKAVEIAIERGWTGFKADWQWQDEQPKHRPKDNMRAEWNTPEAWAEVL